MTPEDYLRVIMLLVGRRGGRVFLTARNHTAAMTVARYGKPQLCLTVVVDGALWSAWYLKRPLAVSLPQACLTVAAAFPPPESPFTFRPEAVPALLSNDYVADTLRRWRERPPAAV